MRANRKLRLRTLTATAVCVATVVAMSFPAEAAEWSSTKTCSSGYMPRGTTTRTQLAIPTNTTHYWTWGGMYNRASQSTAVTYLTNLPDSRAGDFYASTTVDWVSHSMSCVLRPPD